MSKCLAFNSGVLAIGSTKSQIAIGTAVDYTFKGRFYQRATSASVAIPSDGGAYTALAAGEKCALLVVVDPANSDAISGVQGTIVAVGAGAPVPARPAERVVIGCLTISNVTNPFTIGTTFFDAAGVTTTYYNLGQHPGSGSTLA